MRFLEVPACSRSFFWASWVTNVQAAAEVDLDHHVKLAEQAADAAYSPFERQLAQLEALSQVPPVCMSNFAQLYRSASSQSMEHIFGMSLLNRMTRFSTSRVRYSCLTLELQRHLGPTCQSCHAGRSSQTFCCKQFSNFQSQPKCIESLMLPCPLGMIVCFYALPDV